jgi:hypothetical protein
MGDRKRLHREDPARIAPVRNFSKLYSRSSSVNGTNAAKPAQPDAPVRATGGGPLAEGVELAYNVIEKYIAEGRRTAEGLNNQPYETRGGSNDNLQVLVERMLRFQTEMLPLWIETLATLVKVDPSRNGSAQASAAWPHSNGKPNAEPLAVTIEVVSLRPVQVSVELRPNCEPHSLVALGLSAVDSGKPILKDISLAPDEVAGRIKLRLQIPESQPSGTYSGVIVNRDSGETRGTLTIRIAD